MKQEFLDVGQQAVVSTKSGTNEGSAMIASAYSLDEFSRLQPEKGHANR